MKNIIKYIAIFSCVFFTTSCLDQSPIDQIPERDFYKTTEDLNMAVMACYNGLQSTIKYEWSLTEMRTDNTRFYGSNSSTPAAKEFYGLNTFLISTSNSYNQTYWEANYHNIANCNTVFKYINVVENETTRKQFEGEAAFVRAYHYFNLVRLYGPLFLVTENIPTSVANKYERTTEEKVYEFILNDLETIIRDNKLPATYPEASKGRVDMWAAKTLLAKVYLTLGELGKAKDLLEDVYLHSPYKLLTGENAYAKVFSIDNEMNDEIIFTIRFKAGGLHLGSPFANWFAPNNSFNMIINSGGSGYNSPTNSLVTSYDPLDKRKAVSLAPTWVNPSGATVYTAYCKKYLSQVATIYDAENDWPILRFADVILMLGEIENEQAGPSAGLPYINQTRVRAGLPELASVDVPNKFAFRLAMEKERRFEFAFENHRFFDLVRTNRLIEVMKVHYDTEMIPNSGTGNLNPFYGTPTYLSYLAPESRILKNWQLLLPVPFKVMQVSTNATQNTGY